MQRRVFTYNTNTQESNPCYTMSIGGKIFGLTKRVLQVVRKKGLVSFILALAAVGAVTVFSSVTSWSEHHGHLNDYGYRASVHLKSLIWKSDSGTIPPSSKSVTRARAADDMSIKSPNYKLNDSQSAERQPDVVDELSETQQPRLFQVARRAETVQVGNTSVHVMSVIARDDYPTPGTYNALVVTWTGNRPSDSHNFSCCLLRSLDSKESVQVQAQRVLQESGHRDFSYSLYTCSLPYQHNKPNNLTSQQDNFAYAAFTDKACDVTMTPKVHVIDKPVEPSGPDHFAVCIGFAYGNLSIESLIEWLELAKIIGVDKVMLFTDQFINQPMLDLFSYYDKTGFLRVAASKPAIRQGNKQRGFARHRGDPSMQRWSDKQVLYGDCLHRLSKFAFIVTYDFDELLYPLPPYKTMSEVLKVANAEFPEVGAYSVYSHGVFEEWEETHPSSPITFLRRQRRTANNRFSPKQTFFSTPKPLFKPQAAHRFGSHRVESFRDNSKRMVLPTTLYRMLHYRSCAKEPKSWGVCDMKGVVDPGLERFRDQWVHALSRLPLVQLGCSREYAAAIQQSAHQLNV